MQRSLLQEKEMIHENPPLQTVTLPHHLVSAHILPRLPVKSLIRFKSVSKHWYSFISTPYFAKSHLQFSPNPLQNFLIKNEKGFFLLPYDEHSCKELVELDSRSIPPMRIVSVIGCCNGLVCLNFGMYENGSFAFWNPATRQYRGIDYPDSNCKLDPVIYGFGYASLIDDFKIVAAFMGADDLYVFSLRTGNWRRVCRLEEYSISKTKDYNGGLFVDNAIYWTFNRLGDEPSSCILGFDLVGEQFKPITKPPNCVDEYYSICTHAIKGCLAVCCNLDVWILKQNNGDLHSWEKLFSIHQSLDQEWYCYALSSTGKWLVQLPGQLKLIDPTQEAPPGISNVDPLMDVEHYVEGLFSPFGTTKSDEGEENDVNK